MRSKIAKNSARVVEFDDPDQPALAVYPDQICAARMVGASRQAINQAIKNGTRVKGHLWMRLFDYDQMIQANEAAKREGAPVEKNKM